jgi:voltage-gated potassium channel
MKFLASQITYFLTQGETRRSLWALVRYLAFLVGIMIAYSVLFHALMLYEGHRHSWLTGFYWTLTVMSTLGFGDITFHTDLGRVFSIVVLLSGIFLLLIVLPFIFIRLFYAPWLENHLRLYAPREAARDTSDHVILCRYDEIVQGLASRLDLLSIPYYVIEPDPAAAAALHADGVSVVTGELDNVATYQALHTERAKLVVANVGDAENTNITLTVREAFPDVPVVAFAEDENSLDILELSGATLVLPLKHRLGEHLASRLDVGAAHTHVVGRFEDLLIAEFPLHNTGLAGRTLRDTRLRELTGLSVVACWDRGRLRPARPETVLSTHSVPVVVGTEEQMTDLDAMFAIYRPNQAPVLVIGGGKVGHSVARALKRRDIVVHIVERDPTLRDSLSEVADEVIIGDAAALDIEHRAGIETASAVVLSTADDATNIFLTLYCRRLNPDAHIASRISHDRNLEAIHRAGADSVLSGNTLGIQALLSLIQGRDIVLMGEGVEVFTDEVPPRLVGKTLGESGIGSTTGLSVVAVQTSDGLSASPSAVTELAAGSKLLMCGTAEQREEFRQNFA